MIESTNNMTIEELYSDWNEVLSSKWTDSFLETINCFIMKWAVSPLPDAQEMMDKAFKELEERAEFEQTESDWKEARMEDTLLAYKHFIEEHPNSPYYNDAKENFYSLKQNLLYDMKNKSSFCYNREDMYSYISSGVLTYEDLVTTTDILDDRAYYHIIKFPRQNDEQRCLPVSKLEDPESPCGNVDVYPFGVCGSGGKTCLLASIMALFDNKDFSLHNCLGTEYARHLSNYMLTSTLPPATDQSYIQVIETSLKGTKDWYNISFVEFSGEKAADIAGDDEKEFVSYNVGVNLCGLMNNNNKKILLFAVDLTNEKYFNLYRCDGDTQWVHQSDIAECWASRLLKDAKFCKELLAIKIIITKKDEFGIKSTQQAINALVDNGYKVFYDGIVDLCHKYKIMPYNNFMPEVIPFCIGKFMPGDVYNFDDSDAKILLDSIRRDLDYHHANQGIMDKMRKIFKI